MTLPADPPESDSTRFTIDVLVDGVLPGAGNQEYTLTIYDDEAGEGAAPLAPPIKIPVSAAEDGRILREQVALWLPRVAVEGEQVRLRAELKLPHRGVSTHTNTVFLFPEGDPAWSLSFPETLSGEDIFAPISQLPPEIEEPFWQLMLAPGTDDQGPPNATLSIAGHRGRPTDCRGETGTFALALIAESASHRYAGDEATIEITRFDEVAFEATLFGSVERWDKSRPVAHHGERAAHPTSAWHPGLSRGGSSGCDARRIAPALGCRSVASRVSSEVPCSHRSGRGSDAVLFSSLWRRWQPELMPTTALAPRSSLRRVLSPSTKVTFRVSRCSATCMAK